LHEEEEAEKEGLVLHLRSRAGAFDVCGPKRCKASKIEEASLCLPRDEESPTGLGTSGGGIDNDEEDYFSALYLT
jgi:hypothetical protein